MAGKFSLDISKFVQKAKANARAVERKVVLDLGTAIVMRTPVGDPSNWKTPAPEGYVGGRARGSWQYAQGGPATVEPGTIDESGQVSIGRITAGVLASPGAQVHFVTSTVPYIRRLEYEAWSKQAPEGMVRLSVEEYARFIDKAIKELP